MYSVAYTIDQVLYSTTKDLLGLDWDGTESTGQFEDTCHLSNIEFFPSPYLTPYTQIDLGWVAYP